ncbi:hypothetical protein ABZ922_45120 [Streptomyces shenzhenensis]|uniref:hypothetical protein n=1 Tax=Streptomyces shenzhenensis TaxID=943815 RepID=UPI0033D375EB
MTWTLLSPAYPAVIAFVMLARLVYRLGMRKENELPRSAAVTAAWQLGFLALSLSPWALASVFTDDHSRGDLLVV